MTYTKTVAAIGIASSLLMGCSSSNSPTAPGKPAGYSEDGGVNGGGGGTLPAQPIEMYQVREIIHEAKGELALVFNYQQHLAAQLRSRSETEAKLFLGERTIIDSLYETNLEVDFKAACRDASGKEVDGSIHASEPGAICISAYRIAPKLAEERARIEILALIAHELSHLHGLNEAEATAFQKDIAFHLSYDMKSTNLRDFTDKLAMASMSLAYPLRAVADKSLPTDELIKTLDLFLDSEFDFWLESNKLPYSLISAEADYYRAVLRARLDVAKYFLAAPTDSYAADELKKIFHGETQVTFLEYAKADRRIDPEMNPYADEVITLPTSELDVRSVARDSVDFYSALAAVPRTLRFGTRPNILPLPTNRQDPFAPFAGTYSVTTASCTDGKKAWKTGFSIELNNSGERVLKTISENGWGYDDLRNGGSVVQSGAFMRVSGTPGTATREVEFGDRWGSRQLTDFSKQTLKMEERLNGFRIKETFYTRSENRTTDRFEVSESSCTYELKKTK